MTGYLLNVSHSRGGLKARFFLRYGFEPEKPAVLAEALHEHALAATSRVAIIESVYGQRLRIDGPLAAPDGAQLAIRAIWQVERGSATAMLVTAYPTG